MSSARILVIAGVAVLFGCGRQSDQTTSLTTFPISNLDQVVTASGVTFDRDVSADGDGSLRIESTETVSVPLFVVTDPDVENARLIYRARLRTENVAGKAYLEMFCRFPERGEYFSRGLDQTLTGTTDWTVVETFFNLRKGENPDLVRLNLVVEGTGTIWIDQIEILKAPPLM